MQCRPLRLEWTRLSSHHPRIIKPNQVIPYYVWGKGTRPTIPDARTFICLAFTSVTLYVTLFSPCHMAAFLLGWIEYSVCCMSALGHARMSCGQLKMITEHFTHYHRFYCAMRRLWPARCQVTSVDSYNLTWLIYRNERISTSRARIMFSESRPCGTINSVLAH